jgi:hypothetical protein
MKWVMSGRRRSTDDDMLLRKLNWLSRLPFSRINYPMLTTSDRDDEMVRDERGVSRGFYETLDDY